MVWAVSLSTMDIITHSLTAKYFDPWHSEFDYDQYREMRPSHIQCSTSKGLNLTLALKLFRGEPAISKFVWLFTPNHSSSADFSTSVGSALHLISLKLQPGHG